MTSLQDERTYQMFDPNPLKLQEIDEKISVQEKRLNEAIYQYNDLKNEFDDFLRVEDNIELKKIIL